MINASNQMNVSMSKMFQAFLSNAGRLGNKIISKTFNGMMKVIMFRFETLEQVMPTHNSSMDLTKIKNAIQDIEKEKLKKAKRSKTVIISDLLPQPMMIGSSKISLSKTSASNLSLSMFDDSFHVRERIIQTPGSVLFT